MSDHPEIIEPIRKMLENDRASALPAAGARARASALPAAGARARATRAVGFLEGMSMWLWQQVGPNLDDGIAVEYDRRVADIAEYVDLPPREG